MLILPYGLFLLGLLLVIKGADYLVTGASSIASRLRISQLTIGLSVVAFGTSLPELMVSVMSAVTDHPALAIGNILGSNIANVFLVLGFSAIICNLPIKDSTILTEIPFSLTAALLVGFLANAALFDPTPELTISRLDGFILLGFFMLFMVYLLKLSGGSPEIDAQIPGELDSSVKSMVYITIGLAALFLGGHWVVTNAIIIAKLHGLSESFIGLTIIAVGTSLPELVTCGVAASRGQTDIAVGTVVGSNIFNLLWVLGITATIKKIPFDQISNTDLVMVIFSSTMLIVALAVGRKYTIDRWNGIVFVLIYFAYIFYLTVRG